jgi:predicted nucleotidyltransferase
VDICKRYHIQQLAVFGSILRPDFTPTSDVDVVVAFAPHSHIGWEIVYLEDELATLFGGRKIDLVTYKALNPFIRETVLATAMSLYEQG